MNDPEELLLHRVRLRIHADLLAQILDLPRDIDIREARITAWEGHYIDLLIVSPNLPALNEGDVVPDVCPVYQLGGDGRVKMIKFDSYDGPVGRRAVDG